MEKQIHQGVEYGADYTAEAPTPFGLGIHHVQLSIPAGTEDDCRRFYVGILGFTEVRKPPVLAARGGLWLRADNLEIHLGVEGDFRAAKKSHPGILVTDLDALARHVGGHGLVPEWDDAFPGMRRFYLQDNNGNRLEFLSPASWPAAASPGVSTKS